MSNRRYNRFDNRLRSRIFLSARCVYLAWRNSLDIYCPLLPRRQRRCTCGPACPARETGTRSQPWCVFLLIPLQNPPSNLANFDERNDTREYHKDQIWSMRRSVLTQKTDPTDSCPSGIAAFNFCRTRPWRIQMQKFSSRSARYASIVTDATIIPWII